MPNTAPHWEDRGVPASPQEKNFKKPPPHGQEKYVNGRWVRQGVKSLLLAREPSAKRKRTPTKTEIV